MRKTLFVVAAMTAITGPFVSIAVAGERPLDGAEAQRVLNGRRFALSCVDGTSGSARLAGTVVSANYLRGGDDSGAVRDFGHVRASGGNLCIRWKELNGGVEGCYQVSQRSENTYRIASGMGWCDLSVR
jgi:hypothetical protein